MNNEGWGYFILFLVLISPLIWWAWHSIGKTLWKDPYDDNFGGLV